MVISINRSVANSMTNSPQLGNGAHKGRLGMSLVNRIYERGEVVTADGQIRKLHSHISREEGTFLYNLIRADLGIVRTLEIGCAYGLSSLHICKALGDRSAAHH